MGRKTWKVKFGEENTMGEKKAYCASLEELESGVFLLMVLKEGYMRETKFSAVERTEIQLPSKCRILLPIGGFEFLASEG